MGFNFASTALQSTGKGYKTTISFVTQVSVAPLGAADASGRSEQASIRANVVSVKDVFPHVFCNSEGPEVPHTMRTGATRP
ncbi:hypothetical protein BV210_09530 [Halorientalis sp. IM1011]|nr:hypothetical protein BV210_09530 [Halorientalis sp. IM1011]